MIPYPMFFLNALDIGTTRRSAGKRLTSAAYSPDRLFGGSMPPPCRTLKTEFALQHYNKITGEEIPPPFMR